MSARPKLTTDEQMTIEEFLAFTGWQARTVAGLDAALEVPTLGLTLPLADVYRWTSIARDLARDLD